MRSHNTAMDTVKLNYQDMHREGSNSDGIIKTERLSIDFTVEGKSLFRSLIEAEGINAGTRLDLIGCFSKDWNLLNEESKKQLLLSKPSGLPSGRVALYICPECGYIDCGAYVCKIKRENDYYVWSDFAYEDGHDEPEPIPAIGPFKFDVKEYEIVINRMCSTPPTQ